MCLLIGRVRSNDRWCETHRRSLGQTHFSFFSWHHYGRVCLLWNWWKIFWLSFWLDKECPKLPYGLVLTAEGEIPPWNSSTKKNFSGHHFTPPPPPGMKLDHPHWKMLESLWKLAKNSFFDQTIGSLRTQKRMDGPGPPSIPPLTKIPGPVCLISTILSTMWWPGSFLFSNRHSITMYLLKEKQRWPIPTATQAQSIWLTPWENLSSGVCEQHRRRPACASAQSDQRFCYSRFVKYNI